MAPWIVKSIACMQMSPISFVALPFPSFATKERGDIHMQAIKSIFDACWHSDCAFASLFGGLTFA